MSRGFSTAELYAIQTDIGEGSNVYWRNPSVVTDLLAKLENWRTSTGVAITHLAPKLSTPILPAPNGAVLKLTADCVVDATNPEQIIQISGTGYKLLPDDYLHFDIKAEVGSKTDGYYISPFFNTGKYFSTKRGIDQFGQIQVNTPAPLGGAGVWEHRVIGMGNEAPSSVNKFSIILRKTGKYTIFIDNLQIR
ncbi:MAG: hypothetical protein NTY32_11595, partial [Bacteroidia bacterium]|nr:hypothetical protein [Bacteroidia bacterium]